MELDYIWFLDFIYVSNEIYKNKIKEFSKIIEIIKKINSTTTSTTKEYLINQFKEMNIANFSYLINSNKLTKSFIFKIIDSFKGEKIKILMKIKNLNKTGLNISFYISEKSLQNLSSEYLEQMKYYLQNHISNQIFKEIT